MASGAHHRETWSSSTEERHVVLSVGNRLWYIIAFEKEKAPDTPPPHRYWLSDATGWSQTKMIGMKSRKYLAVMLISFQLCSLFVLSGNKFSVLNCHVYIWIGLSISSDNLKLQGTNKSALFSYNSTHTSIPAHYFQNLLIVPCSSAPQRQVTHKW